MNGTYGYLSSPSMSPGLSTKVIMGNFLARDVMTSVDMHLATSETSVRPFMCGSSSTVASPVRVSRRFPEVTKVKPDVSIATPVRWTVSSTYQLMNEDLPAEWLPTISTVIFSRGGSSS